MYELVSFEVTLGYECFLAPGILAVEWSVSCVTSQVSLQSAQVFEVLQAVAEGAENYVVGCALSS